MRIVRTRIESAIAIARGCGSVIEKELANGIVKETDIAKDRIVVTEIEDRRIIEAVAETDHIEIAIATETDIEIGKDRSKNRIFFYFMNTCCIVIIYV